MTGRASLQVLRPCGSGRSIDRRSGGDQKRVNQKARRLSFRYWRWKARSLGGRPQIETDLRVLIRRMSIENPLWGAPRIHGELLKLGFEVAQSSVAKYMVK